MLSTHTACYWSHCGFGGVALMFLTRTGLWFLRWLFCSQDLQVHLQIESLVIFSKEP